MRKRKTKIIDTKLSKRTLYNYLEILDEEVELRDLIKKELEKLN